MNAEDRQALREKHRTDNNVWCVVCVEVLPNTEGFQGLSGAAMPARYPCDIIKVLDATDTQRQAIIDVLALGHTDAAELRDAILKVLQ